MSHFRIIEHIPNHFVAIEKPAGFHVHPPEDQTFTISKRLNILALLRDQMGHYLYPVHRLDVATSGVLVYALSSDSARWFQESFQSRAIQKQYLCVIRGWLSDKEGKIDDLLDEKESVTRYKVLSEIELPCESKKFKTSRYSFLVVWPETGRMHQIRRHFRKHSHPLIGDTLYGDGIHNRYFRTEHDLNGLMLRADQVRFKYLPLGLDIHLTTCDRHRWLKIFELFQLNRGQIPVLTGI